MFRWLAKLRRQHEAELIVELIDKLREEEGSSVTILCDNPDFNGEPDRVVIVNAPWTNYEDWRFGGRTLLGALEEASIQQDFGGYG